MMKKKCSMKTILIAVFLLCAVICAAGLSTGNRLPNGMLPPLEDPVLDQGWTYDMGVKAGKIDAFPFSQKDDFDYLIISTELPHIDGGEFLAFTNQYSSCRVFVDGEQIYNYGESPTAPFGRMLGNSVCTVPLKSEYSGKTISVRFDAEYSFAHFTIQSVLLGSASEIRFYYSRENIGVLVCGLLMLIMALVTVVMYFVQKSKRLQYNYRVFLHLGVFSFIGAVWIWTDSVLPQLIYGDTILITVLSFWSFMSMPIPVLCIVDSLCSCGNKALRAAERLILLNMILQTVLYLMNIVDFPQLLLVTHGILVLSLICMLYSLLRESGRSEGKYAKGILSALLVMMLFGFAALVRFYIVGVENNNSFYYRLGIVIFVIMLILVNVERMGAFVEEWRESRVLSRLAFVDVMTHMKNRSAYERFVDENQNADIKTKKLSMVLLDLNDLKLINDTYGHAAGDQVLIGAAKCIHETFDQVGESYRIGGDEFVVIIEGRDIDAQSLIASLNRAIERRSAQESHGFTLACGFASAAEDGCTSLKELQKKADYRMYMNKKKGKEENPDTLV